MRRGRHIGQRINEVCKISEQLGTSPASAIAAHCEGSACNTKKYCERAVGHGLMKRHDEFTPVRYTVSANWRLKINRINIGEVARSLLPHIHPLQAVWHSSKPVSQPRNRRKKTMTTATPENKDPVPFEQQRFKALIGLDSDGDNITMRVGVADKDPDLSDPAIYMAHWLSSNWNSVRNLAASEYNVQQNLAMATAKPALQLIDPKGGFLQ